MLSKRQVGMVWKAIRELPPKSRPQDVRHAFDLVLLHQGDEGNDVLISREEMATEMGIGAQHVSTAMNVLVKMGVLERKMHRVKGIRGPGIVAYSVNPHIGWVGSLDARQDAAATTTPPLLTLMQGGAQKTPERGPA